MNGFLRTLFGLLASLLWMLLIVLIVVFPVMWLWNYTMPWMFGLKELDFWHAWATLVLCGLLFKAGR